MGSKFFFCSGCVGFWARRPAGLGLWLREWWGVGVAKDFGFLFGSARNEGSS